MPNSLGPTFGVFLVANFLQAILYGMGLLQVYLYFFWYHKDPWFIRVSVVLITLTETFGVGVYLSAAYSYLIDGFGELQGLTLWNWQIRIGLVSLYLPALIAQIYFAYCIHRLHTRDKIIPALILILATACFGSGIAQLVRNSHIQGFKEQSETTVTRTLQASFALACDVLITVALCWRLSKSKTGIQSTNKVLNYLIVTAINRGVLTMLSAALNIILFTEETGTFYFMLIMILGGKFYMNSMLATLNTRTYASGLFGSRVVDISFQNSGPPKDTNPVVNIAANIKVHDDPLAECQALMGRSPQKKSRSHTAPAKSRRGKGGATRNGGGGSPPREKAASKRKVKAPKKADEVEEKENDGGDSGAARVFWDKDATRTERLLDWLTVNVDDRLKLFSDSTQDANEQGRKKQTGKTTKMAYYLKMADAVFSVDASDTVRADYVENPNRYARSVENYLGRLRKRYRDINNELGQTGAGLKPEDVTPESEIANKIAKIKVDFPYWEQLHGFWRTLPNFNPYTVSSEPGQDIADQALALITRDKAMASPPDEVIQDSEQDLFNFAGLERTPDRISESGSEPIPDWSPTPTKTKPIEIDDDDDDTSPPKFQLRPPKKPAALQNSSKGNSGSTSSASSSSSTVKPRAKKRSRADAFAEETEKQNQILQQLGKEKHDRRMAELAVKRQKLEVDLQRDTLAAEERRLAADERRREADHKREREREQHQLMMMRMQFTMRGNNAMGANDGFFGGEMNFNRFGDGMGGGLGYFDGAGPSV
ncbi:hypothetical protein B0H13DRAFT_2342151 [Mycena leptocephala]|nr:hypothetical protein B0H13DRAFT_2342151 [Mycena leptocephala]